MPVQPVNRQPTPSSSKRKQLESQYTQGTGKKRRSDVYDDDADDPEVGEDGASGARHWTDEEKTKLFNWLMGPNEDEHFDALRTKKNTCFRDVSHPMCAGVHSLSLILLLFYSAHWMHLVVAKPS